MLVGGGSGAWWRGRGGVLAGSPAVWGGTYPHNPFAVPTTVAANGDGAALARGLLEGQLRQVLEDVRVLRRARAELERISGKRGHDGAGELDWESLTAEERRLCPPLVLLTSETELGGAALGSSLAVLDTELPLKVIALAAPGTRGDSALVALTVPRAWVAQTSVADFDHLGGALGEALAYHGPAFVRILAPSPIADSDMKGAVATLDAARAAVSAGDFPLWKSSPEERDGRSLAELLKPPVAEEPIVEPTTETAATPAPDAGDLAALEQRHAAEVANLRAQYEAHIAQLNAGLRAEMARQVHGKLMQLVSGARVASARSDRAEPGDGARPEAGE